MYAVILTGGKQYKVAVGEDVFVEKLEGEAGETLAEGLAAIGSRPVGLVLGAEGPGLREKTRETCDRLVRIPYMGAFGSLNVSNAAAVSLYAATSR